MIKAKKGKVEFKGSIAEIRADISTISKSFYQVLTEHRGRTEEEAKESILLDVKRGLMTEEELLCEMLKEFREFVDELLEDDKKEEKADE